MLTAGESPHAAVPRNHGSHRSVPPPPGCESNDHRMWNRHSPCPQDRENNCIHWDPRGGRVGICMENSIISVCDGGAAHVVSADRLPRDGRSYSHDKVSILSTREDGVARISVRVRHLGGEIARGRVRRRRRGNVCSASPE